MGNSNPPLTIINKLGESDAVLINIDRNLLQFFYNRISSNMIPYLLILNINCYSN